MFLSTEREGEKPAMFLPPEKEGEKPATKAGE
jgi:hypothetical protein